MSLLRRPTLSLALVLAGSSFAPTLALSVDDGDDAYQLIYGLYEKGLHEMVVDEAQDFLRENPRHRKAPLARYRLGSSLFELERYAPARDAFRPLTARTGFEFANEVRFRLGQCELALGNYAAAIEALDAVTGSDADYLHQPATFLLGEAAFQAGDFARAELAYGRVVSRDPNGEHARDAAYGLAWCAFRLDEPAEAAQRARTFLQRWKDDPLAAELQHLLGEAELASGRPREALVAFLAVPRGEYREAALYGAGFASAELGEHLDAARSFAMLIDEFPGSELAAESTLHLGIHLLEAGRAENALAAFALPQARPTPELLYWKARALVANDDREAALTALDDARRRQPEPALAERIGVLRGDVLFALGRADEAAEAYGESTSDYALHAAAVASFNDGRPEEAVRLATTLLERFPDGTYSLPTRLTLGEALFALERYADARLQFGIVAGSGVDEGDRARALLRAGWCDYLRGDLAAAAKAFDRVTRVHAERPEALEAWFMEGRARQALGDVEGASSALMRYLELDRGGVHAPTALLALSRLDEGPRGRRFLETLLREHPESAEVPPALFELGERLSAADELEAARESYGALAERFPEDELVGPALYGSAWASYSLEEDAAAIDALARLERQRDVDEELRVAALELKVFAAQRAGRTDVAVAAWNAFQALCRDESRRLACARVVASTLEAGGEAAAARKLVSSLVRELREPAARLAAHVESAWLALTLDDVEGAESDVREALRLDGTDAAALEAAFFVGEERYAAGDDARAAALYDLATVEDSPVADRALYKAGFVALRAGENAAAAEHFGALVQRFPRSELWGESLFLQGEAEFRAGAHDRAARRFARMLAELPRHASVTKARYRLGISLCELGKWADAERTLTDLARSAPEFEHGVEAELWRGRALAAQGKARAARQAYDRVVARDEGVLAARARLGLGKLALSEQDLEAALSEFLKVALLYAHDEEVAEALLLAGDCLAAKGQTDKAAEQYRELLEKYPTTSWADEARERLDG